MTLDQLRDYCLNKPGVSEHTPFDERTLVFKVGGKIFCLTDMIDFHSVNLKCDPELAIERRETFKDVLPGYHMSKKHWNTVVINGDVDDNLFFDWIDESYALIVASLPKKQQANLETR